MNWISPIRSFKRVFIHPDSKESVMTQKILEKIGSAEILPWKDPKIIYQDLIRDFSDPYEEAKQTMVLTPFKGAFVKKCPGSNTKGAVCCNYYVLNFMSQCPF